MALKDITITSSINSLPTLSYGQKTYIPSNDYQSFPIVSVIGEYGLPYELGDITQSYSESINTPAGRISFVDSTRTEFIDGQFKGSEFIATNGELSKNNPFTLVSTLKTFYTPVYYYDIPDAISNNNRNDIPLSNFLDPNTTPEPGEIYIGASVSSIGGLPLNLLTWQTYAIKIATIDNVGNINTVALQSLESFKIIFSNGTNITCDVTSIIDYTSQGYIMYWVKPVTKTLRAHEPDGKVLNYTLSASFTTTSVTGPTGADEEAAPITGSFNLSYNSLNYFDSSSGIFVFSNTPNTRLYITASFNTTATTKISIRTFPDLNTSLFSQQVSSGSNRTISRSFTPIADQQYAIVFTAPLPSGNTTISNFQFLVTQSQNVDTGSSDLTVLSPYFTQNFFYNDWNALYGNADGLEFDQNYMKVNYETGQSIPTNQEEIISGSAERAPVKPYNYALKAQTLPRYEGVRLYQYNENVWTENDVSFGKEPSVKLTETYFIYFNQTYDTSPILKNKTGFDIKYLIDENGEVYTPSLVTNEYYNLIDSFETGKKAYVSSLSGLSTPLSDPKPIKLSGMNYTPVLYSVSSSNPLIWTDTIDFVNFDGTSGSNVPNFNSIVGPSNNYLDVRNTNSGTVYSLTYASGFGGSNFNGSSGYQTQGNWLKPGGGNAILGSDDIEKFKFTTTPESKVTINVYLQAANGNSSNFDFRFGLKINGSYLPNNQYGAGTVPPDKDYEFSWSYSYFPLLGDELEFWFQKMSGGSQFSNQVKNVKITIKTSNLIIAPATSPFWTTGSYPCNVLTSSNEIGDAYNQYIQKTIPNSGMEDINEIFTIKPNDEFRFEYEEDPSNIFTVVSTTTGSNDSTIYVTLDRNLPSSSISSFNIDHFTIRRLNKNSDVILDTKYSPITFGFLFPEYPSDKINNNLQNIIKNLNEKGLL